MNKNLTASLAGVGVLALAMSGCGGGSSSGGGGGATGPSLTVTPSLGKVFNTPFEVRCLSMTTGNVIGTGNTGATGSATITLTNTCTGPVIVDLAPTGSSTYFDEALNNTVALPISTTLRAIVPSLTGVTAVGVTPLTEAAARDAITHATAGLETNVTAAGALAANTSVVTQVLGSGAAGLNILTPPTLWDSGTAAGSLGNAAADQYAFYLASLARMGGTTGTPALNVMNTLAADIAVDGSLSGGTINGTAYTTTLTTMLTAAKAAMATFAGSQLAGTMGVTYTPPPAALYNLTVTGTFTAPVIGTQTIPNGGALGATGVVAPTLDSVRAAAGAAYTIGSGASVTVTQQIDTVNEKKYRVQFAITVPPYGNVSYDLTYDYVKQ